MADNSKVYNMSLAKVYPLLVNKVVRKGRTQNDVDFVTSWLTGYSIEKISELVASDISYGDFFAGAHINPDAYLIKGSVCGVKVHEIEDPFMRQVRILDKLVDDLAKGKPIEKILPQK